MDLSTAMWAAVVVGAVTVYWFMWVIGSAKVKGKRAVNLKMGLIMRDKKFDIFKAEITRALTMRRQSSFMKFHSSNSWSRNSFVIWVVSSLNPKFCVNALCLNDLIEPRNVSYLFPLLISSHHIMQTCFFRQFGKSVVWADYLTLRQGFILNHNLTPRYDFHSYMIRSMEEEFKRIVGVSPQLWGFVNAFMLFNING
ncbi:hypothetical protein ZIOFF_018919 [Zingiber officinale]|uniref:Uncharacterized protein n=1 Tax=Zingiber officinale TaxID=94328 RepID=A0A8J5HLD8_ZINOF|nr:hypothetical protein ZIOFF_018919 [Zingiber officinale]